MRSAAFLLAMVWPAVLCAEPSTSGPPGTATGTSSAKALVARCPTFMEMEALKKRRDALWTSAWSGPQWLSEWNSLKDEIENAKNCTPGAKTQRAIDEERRVVEEERRAAVKTSQQTEYEQQEAEDAQRAAEEAQREAEHEAMDRKLRSNKPAVQLVASSRFCLAALIERNALAVIKEEKENSKIAGVQNVLLLKQKQDDVVIARKLQRESRPLIPGGKPACGSKTIKHMMECMLDPDQDTCQDAQVQGLLRLHRHLFNPE